MSEIDNRRLIEAMRRRDRDLDPRGHLLLAGLFALAAVLLLLYWMTT